MKPKIKHNRYTTQQFTRDYSYIDDLTELHAPREKGYDKIDLHMIDQATRHHRHPHLGRQIMEDTNR